MKFVGKCKCGGLVAEDKIYWPAVYCVMCGKRDERRHLWEPDVPMPEKKTQDREREEEA